MILSDEQSNLFINKLFDKNKWESNNLAEFFHHLVALLSVLKSERANIIEKITLYFHQLNP